MERPGLPDHLQPNEIEGKGHGFEVHVWKGVGACSKNHDRGGFLGISEIWAGVAGNKAEIPNKQPNFIEERCVTMHN